VTPAPAIEHVVRPIGRVRGGRTDKDDTDHWGDVICEVVVDPERFGPGALAGLDGFSHVEVVFVFDQVSERSDYTVTRPGRGRPDLPPVGVFSDRGPRRPNRIGTTMCEIVDIDGNRVRVRGLDALDDTPVLDLKPVMRQLVPSGIRQPAWVDDLMSRYHA
jgi:tRNA (Thr-GGU) A37 N-methylase